MSKTEHAKVQLSDGKLRDLDIEVSTDEPWTLELQSLGDRRCIKTTSLFEALRRMREDLEGTGARLLCAGSRPDVNASGRSRSMGRRPQGLYIAYGKTG
jgi:hypothetical protein